MSLWGTLFGSENVIKRAADGIYNGVDKAIYTNEEKASGFLNLLKAYEPFKLAQRLVKAVRASTTIQEVEAITWPEVSNE